MSGFAVSVFKLLRGSAAAQLIAFLALPMLTRAFEPESFGTLQALQALVSVPLVASALRLEIAVLSSPPDELPHLLALCGWLCLGTSLLTAGAVALWSIVHPPATTQLGSALFLLPPMVLLAGLGQVLGYLLLRGKDFDVVAGSKVAQVLAFVVSALALAPAFATSAALAASDAVGRLALVISSLRRRIAARLTVWLPSRTALSSIWCSHRRLVLVALPGSIVNALGGMYAPLLILVVFDAYHAGQYALVERLLAAPIALICSAASQVFAAGFADAKRDSSGAPRARFRRMVSVNLAIGIAPALLLFWAAPALFPWLLGESWQTAGRFAQAMMPLMLASFVVMPISMALVLNGDQWQQLTWDVGRLVVLVATWGAVALADIEPLPAVWMHSATASATYIVYLLMVDRSLGRSSSAATHT